MANTSIFNAFERMWQHIVAELNNKSDKEHTHDEFLLKDESNNIYVQNDEPLDAPEGSLWIDMDDNGVINDLSNIATLDDVHNIIDYKLGVIENGSY